MTTFGPILEWNIKFKSKTTMNYVNQLFSKPIEFPKEFNRFWSKNPMHIVHFPNPLETQRNTIGLHWYQTALKGTQKHFVGFIWDSNSCFKWKIRKRWILQGKETFPLLEHYGIPMEKLRFQWFSLQKHLAYGVGIAVSNGAK